MKKIIIYSVMCVLSMISAEESAQVMRLKEELRVTDEKRDDNRDSECLAEQALLKTEKGEIYRKVCSDWHDCLRANECGSPMCDGLKKDIEGALVDLQKADEYPKYLSAITQRDYYSTKDEGLRRALDFAVFQSKAFGSETEAMFAAVNSMEKSLLSGKPSTTYLAWTNDYNKTFAEVQEELRAYVDREAFLRIEELRNIIAQSNGNNIADATTKYFTAEERLARVLMASEDQEDCAKSPEFKEAFCARNKAAIQLNELMQSLVERKEIKRLMKKFQ